MWGAAVQGSVKMEELGEKSRVHISDCAAELLEDAFPLEMHLSEDGSLMETFGINATYLVKETEIDLATYSMSTVRRPGLPNRAPSARRPTGRPRHAVVGLSKAALSSRAARRGYCSLLRVHACARVHARMTRRLPGTCRR